MGRLVYNWVLSLGGLLALPFIGLALLIRPRYRLGLAQRLSRLPPTVTQRLGTRAVVWLHAPSVGESLATRPFLRGLKAQFPDATVVLSVLTPTAYRAATSRLPEADAVIYFPLDHPLCVRRVLGQIRPSVFFFTETEIWPNCLSILHRQGVPTVLVSGRFSARAAHRYGLLRPVFGPVLRSLSLCCMQTQADAERVIAAGVPHERVVVTGNFKVDGSVESDERGKAILQELGLADRPVLIAASTHRGEEEILLDGYRRLRTQIPALLLLLAPRHPQRFGEVETLLKQAGLGYTKRSQPEPPGDPAIEVFLLDSLGELASFYSAAAVVFVGGSLVKGPGGHSVIEPALARVPVVFGPYTRNFTSIVDALKQTGGGIEVADAGSLARHALPLLGDLSLSQQVGQRAYTAIRQEHGAVERTVRVIRERHFGPRVG